MSAAINSKVSAETKKKFDEISKITGYRKSKVVELAIDLLHKEITEG